LAETSIRVLIVDDHPVFAQGLTVNGRIRLCTHDVSQASLSNRLCEVLVKEESDSLAWKRFCHLNLADRVPDSTTLFKLTHKFGEGTERSLNDTLVLKLKEGKVTRVRKLRIDTTVVESDIQHPLLTDRNSK